MLDVLINFIRRTTEHLNVGILLLLLRFRAQPALIEMRGEFDVAFSGGGIRSAAYCSGVLRWLIEKSEKKPDYLSCVSGGGYTGSAYVQWEYSRKQEVMRWASEFCDHMKELKTSQQLWAGVFFDCMKKSTSLQKSWVKEFFDRMSESSLERPDGLFECIEESMKCDDEKLANVFLNCIWKSMDSQEQMVKDFFDCMRKSMSSNESWVNRFLDDMRESESFQEQADVFFDYIKKSMSSNESWVNEFFDHMWNSKSSQKLENEFFNQMRKSKISQKPWINDLLDCMRTSWKSWEKEFFDHMRKSISSQECANEFVNHIKESGIYQKLREENFFDRMPKPMSSQESGANDFFDQMRKNAGYICNWQKCGCWDCLILTALLMLVTLIVPVVGWGSFACPIAFLVKFLYGHFLDGTLCRREADSIDCKERTYFFFFSFVTFVLFHLLERLIDCCEKKENYLEMQKPKVLTNICQLISGASFVFTFFPWFINDFLQYTYLWVRLAIVVLTGAFWLFVPLLRKYSSLVILIYAYSYVVYWHLYERELFSIKYTEKRFRYGMIASLVMLAVFSVLGDVSLRLVHIYNRLV